MLITGYQGAPLLVTCTDSKLGSLRDHRVLQDQAGSVRTHMYLLLRHVSCVISNAKTASSALNRLLYDDPSKVAHGSERRLA